MGSNYRNSEGWGYDIKFDPKDRAYFAEYVGARQRPDRSPITRRALAPGAQNLGGPWSKTKRDLDKWAHDIYQLDIKPDAPPPPRKERTDLAGVPASISNARATEKNRVATEEMKEKIASRQSPKRPIWERGVTAPPIGSRPIKPSALPQQAPMQRLEQPDWMKAAAARADGDPLKAAAERVNSQPDWTRPQIRPAPDALELAMARLKSQTPASQLSPASDLEGDDAPFSQWKRAAEARRRRSLGGL